MTTNDAPGVSYDGKELSSEDEYNTVEAHDEKWGTIKAYIEIGPGGKGAYFHLRLLKEQIPHFKRVFDHRRLNNYIHYPDLDPAGLKPLQKWVYGVPIAEQKTDACRTSKLFSLYGLACCFEQESLQDETMECIVKEIGESPDESGFTVEHVRFAFQTTPVVSKLQIFCAGWVAEAMEGENRFKWDCNQVSILLAELPELRSDINPPTLRRFEDALAAINNTSCGNHQPAEVDNNTEPVHNKFGSDKSFGSRSAEYGSGSDEHESVKNGRMELDSSADYGDDELESDKHERMDLYHSADFGSDENESDKHGRMELGSSVDSGSDLVVKSPDSTERQLPSPISQETGESDNNKKRKLSPEENEKEAVTKRRRHWETILSQSSDGSERPHSG
ncbi:hypothetical protein BOTCAL_0634g00030 [Botryotinia calthae]|uniref:BTB domain-containing protein n=1 Tax=Botryotinia calthae TaxID=38488 RepID=A0A4Y8CI84_9HELO|nr:hypothetical protein BOTCAL_0634g00030 [Botryotinia calthae]